MNGGGPVKVTTPTTAATPPPPSRPVSHDDEDTPTPPQHIDKAGTEATPITSKLSPPTNLAPSLATPTCYPIPKPLANMQIQPCHAPSTKASPTPFTTSSPPPPSAATTREKVTKVTGQNLSPTEPLPHRHALDSNADTKPSKSSNSPMAPTTKATPPTSSTPPKATPPATPLHWEKELVPGMTETSPELFDANGDGTDDLITMIDLSPCSSTVMALSGRDGSALWQATAHFPGFALRCVLDVNRDHALDCLVSGRSGGFLALDGKDGTVLWSVDPSIVYPIQFLLPLSSGGHGRRRRG